MFQKNISCNLDAKTIDKIHNLIQNRTFIFESKEIDPELDNYIDNLENVIDEDMKK